MTVDIRDRITALQTEAGGWTKESLAALGIEWPPPKGWKEHLESKGQNKPKYTRYRFPIQPEKGLCRGCHLPVPQGRTSWCSTLCYERFEPSRVKLAVKRRDGGVCSICHVQTTCVDSNRARVLGGRGHWNPLWRTFTEGEIDHVVPFSEGGLTIVENLRTLCESCHKKRTREWKQAKRKRP